MSAGPVSEPFDEMLKCLGVLEHIVLIVGSNEEGYVPPIVVVEVFGGGDGVFL